MNPLWTPQFAAKSVRGALSGHKKSFCATAAFPQKKRKYLRHRKETWRKAKGKPLCVRVFFLGSGGAGGEAATNKGSSRGLLLWHCGATVSTQVHKAIKWPSSPPNPNPPSRWQWRLGGGGGGGGGGVQASTLASPFLAHGGFFFFLPFSPTANSRSNRVRTGVPPLEGDRGGRAHILGPLFNGRNGRELRAKMGGSIGEGGEIKLGAKALSIQS